MAFSRDTFVIYQNEFHSGMVETIMQRNVDLNATAGTMSMFPREMQGEFLKETFFKEIKGMVRDRDPNDLTDSTADDIVQGEVKAVKVHKSIHVEKTLNSWNAIGSDPSQFSFVVGTQQGEEVARDYLNSSIAAVVGAIRSEAGLVFDATASATATERTIKPKNLNKMRRLLGDNGQSIRALVMNSTMYYDLVDDAIDAKLTNITDVVVYGGTPATMGLPVIVTDSPFLTGTATVGGTADTEVHYVVGLRDRAVAAMEAEAPTALAEVVGGKKNLIGRIQTEYALMCRVDGFAWTGAEHPTRADLATTTNWDYVFSDVKSAPGVVGVFVAL